MPTLMLLLRRHFRPLVHWRWMTRSICCCCEPSPHRCRDRDEARPTRRKKRRKPRRRASFKRRWRHHCQLHPLWEQRRHHRWCRRAMSVRTGCHRSESTWTGRRERYNRVRLCQLLPVHPLRTRQRLSRSCSARVDRSSSRRRRHRQDRPRRPPHRLRSPTTGSSRVCRSSSSMGRQRRNYRH